MIAFIIPGEPRAFARSRHNGKQHFTPAPQRSFMQLVKLHARDAMRGLAPFPGAVSLQVRATYVAPEAWPKRKRQEARWKTSKPDADNTAKIIKDSLNGIAWTDDAQVAELLVQKTYGPIAQTVVTVMALQSEQASAIQTGDGVAAHAEAVPSVSCVGKQFQSSPRAEALG